MNKELLDYFGVGGLTEEVWERIPSSNYVVSTKGRIMNVGTLNKKDTRGRFGERQPYILKNRLSSNGYYISFNNKLVHRLVAFTFIPNPNNYSEVNHKDGNKLNNLPENLEWCTRAKNIKHAYDIKLRIKKPEESATLTNGQVQEIRDLYVSGNYTQKELGLIYKIGQQSISKIINYKQWK